MSEKRKYRVGSRKSHLAMIQTHWVVQQLESLSDDCDFEIIGISTIGDKILDVALSKIGEKSLFTKELETALLKKEIDFVVHSLKDLPTQLPEGLVIAAISEREDPRDAVLFSPKVKLSNLGELPPGSNVGTSSLRRIAQLTKRYPHLSFIDVRGNLNTRLKKLDDPEGPYSALILATAGVKRMGWEDRIGQHLEWTDCMHAVGQGALGVECAQDNVPVLNLLKSLNHPSTYFCCLAERGFLRTLEGGCSVPVAVTSSLDVQNGQSVLRLKGSVWSLDGSKSICQEKAQNLNEDSNPDRSKDNEIPDFECLLTSVHPRLFEKFNETSVHIAMNTGVSLGRRMLEEGAKDILDEVKAAGFAKNTNNISNN